MSLNAKKKRGVRYVSKCQNRNKYLFPALLESSELALCIRCKVCTSFSSLDIRIVNKTLKWNDGNPEDLVDVHSVPVMTMVIGKF